ncbi:MAG: hypothetical protein JW934_00805 [Anaerolineae bacterium]|nr:hypothetical protein [Anaerolineae bacterium]
MRCSSPLAGNLSGYSAEGWVVRDTQPPVIPDGGVLDAVLISDTLHVAWQGAHYTNQWADYSHRNDANIYYDAVPLVPQPTVQKVYALAGNAAAMRVGPKGEDGDLYYLHGDHTGSLSLVTDAAGNEVGRVWYDPFGEIITHTLPLTLTDRLWTGARRDATMGLYRAAAGWYDPYSTQGIYAGVSVPRAPVGVSIGGAYRSIPAQAGDNALVELGKSSIIETVKGKAGAFFGARSAARLRNLHQARSRTLTLEALQFIQSINRWTSQVEFAARGAQTSELSHYLWRFNQQSLIKEQYEAGTSSLVAQSAQINRMQGWFTQGAFKNELLGLGIGLSIDLGLQAVGDVPMMFTGDLNVGQFGGRMLVTAGGSGLGWLTGVGVGWFLGGPPGFVAGVVVAVIYEYWAVPRFYDRYNLWPKYQQVGPAEPLPY